MPEGKNLKGEDRASVAKEVVAIRDDTGMSWRLISEKLSLGSPGVARKLYEESSGKSHTEARAVVRVNSKPGGSKSSSKKKLASTPSSSPFFAEGVEEEDVRSLIRQGARVTVTYGSRVVTHKVQKFVKMFDDAGGITVEFLDNEGKSRTPGLMSITDIS